MEKERILHQLASLKTELSRRFGIEKIALFGSVARNEANDTSDIDIAIVSMKRKNGFTIARAQTFLSQQLKRPVDIGLLDAMHPFVKKHIEKEMIDV